MDDDTDMVQRRAPAIRHDLAMIVDFCDSQWSVQDMVTHYNYSKTALVKTGLLLATQLHDLTTYLKVPIEQQVSEDNINILAAFWKDTPIDTICRDAKVSMGKLFETGFELVHNLYTTLKAAGLKEHLVVECLVYNSQGYGMDMPTAFKRTMSNEKKMELQMQEDNLNMFGMQSTLQKW